MLRKATRGDMPRIFEIRRSVRENRLDDTFEEYVDLAGPFVDGGHCWVWDENGEVLGEAGYDPCTGHIEVLYVDPAAEGRGVGRALLDQCCTDLHELGHEVAALSTTARTRAEHMYRASGWVEVGIDAVGDLLFQKHLEPKAQAQ
jgi:GNAT superfamily N-acetyltransferase